MPEMTPEDLARFRAAVQLREPCVRAAVGCVGALFVAGGGGLGGRTRR